MNQCCLGIVRVTGGPEVYGEREKSIGADAYVKIVLGQVRWLTLIIPALWETEAGGLLGQEFKTSLDKMVKPHLY